jgi:hypothetical protein
MTASEQILEFIDGSLEAAEEENLFSEMASRSELRSELRELIAIGDAVRSDREAYAPPADVERALLAGLGLGLIGRGAAAAIGVGGGMFASFKGFLPMIASFALGAAIAGGGVFIATQNGADATAAGKATVESSTLFDRTSAASSRTGAARSIAGPEDARSVGHVVSAVHSARTADGVSRQVNSRREGMYVSSAATDAHLTATEFRSLESDELEPGVRGEVDPGARPSAPEPFALSAAPPEITGLTLELRNQAVSRAFVDNNAREVAPVLGDESTLSLGYRVDHDVWFSVELGRSRYTQVLMVDAPRDANGSIRYSRVEQEPNITWVGLGMKGTFAEDVLGFARPFWHGVVGFGLDNGPLMRGRLGLAYDVAAGLSINGSLDASTLVYMYNGQPLVTGKYGLSAGLEFGF